MMANWDKICYGWNASINFKSMGAKLRAQQRTDKTVSEKVGLAKSKAPLAERKSEKSVGL